MKELSGVQDRLDALEMERNRDLQVLIPPPMHCNPGFGKMHFPQLRAALQNRLAAGLWHCNSVYEDLLFLQG